MHCVAPDGGAIIQPTHMAACHAVVDAGGDDAAGDDAGGDDAGDAAAGNDGGVVNDGTCGDSTYGPTVCGNTAGDDDCKYDVTWTSTPICRNQPASFTVKVTKRAERMPLTGANVRPDVVLDCNHTVSSRAADPSPEPVPGTYTVGPVVFDRPGNWSVRFHFFENCYDYLPDTPHGHAAFWVTVP